MRMNLERFSLAAFESLTGDPDAVRHFADELQAAVLAEVGAAAAERFRAVVTLLNTLGKTVS
jgi:hypothetical protein